MYSLFINDVLIESSKDFDILLEQRYSKILELLKDGYQYAEDKDAYSYNRSSEIELLKANDTKKLSILWFGNTDDINDADDINDTNNINDMNDANDINDTEEKIDIIKKEQTNISKNCNKNLNSTSRIKEEKNYKNKFIKKVSKKKYSLRDQRDDLERLELLLISLEAPSEYKKVYTKIYINNGNEKKTNNEINIDTNKSLSLDLFNMNEKEEIVDYYYDIDKGNLIWLNRNLSLLNKRNIKLIETLKLIQRILKKI